MNSEELSVSTAVVTLITKEIKNNGNYDKQNVRQIAVYLTLPHTTHKKLSIERHLPHTKVNSYQRTVNIVNSLSFTQSTMHRNQKQ